MNIWSHTLVILQKIGRSLMLPVASLPVAALLLRFGQTDLLNLPAMAAAGNSIFSNLPLIFAVGVSIGFSERNKTTAAFAGVVAYLIFKESLSTFTVLMEAVVNGAVTQVSKSVDMAVLGGILIGAISGLISDRAVNWKVPDFLGFFSGARLVPIVSGLAAFVLAFIFGYVWPPIQISLDSLGNWIVNAGWVGLAVYGFLNRILIITGLHHVINSMVWFIFGSYTMADGTIVHGDINRFMAGDMHAGAFTAGMYPIMLFGLPAAALAIIVCAKPEKKKTVSAIMVSAAFTSFLTGITEPIEFSFMLIAPFLYFIHAILTGLSMAIVGFFDIHLGFTFSAGMIDYLLMFGLPAQSNALYLLPIGLAFGVVYFFLFMVAIKTFNIMTPGREEDSGSDDLIPVLEGENSFDAVIEALGGIDNIKTTTFCITRLRLELNDTSLVNKEGLKAQGAKGVMFPAGNACQVIFGPKAEKISGYIEPKLKK